MCQVEAESGGREVTKEQEEAIYAAYLGICKLRRCAVKWGGDEEVASADRLLKDMGEAFPLIPARVAAAVSRS
jgi:hypothetical protein